MALNRSFKCFKCFPVCFSFQYCGSLSWTQLLFPTAKFPSLSEKKNRNNRNQDRGKNCIFLEGCSVCVFMCSAGDDVCVGGYFSNPLYRDYFILFVWLWPGWLQGWGGFYGLILHKARNNLSVHSMPRASLSHSLSLTLALSLCLSLLWLVPIRIRCHVQEVKE